MRVPFTEIVEPRKIIMRRTKEIPQRANHILYNSHERGKTATASLYSKILHAEPTFSEMFSHQNTPAFMRSSFDEGRRESLGYLRRKQKLHLCSFLKARREIADSLRRRQEC
jgi:hypothetical protein